MAKKGRELKRYGIRSATKPQAGMPVSGVVVVADDNGRGYCYVKFEESFVDAVGHALPFGVGPEHPAYVKITYMRSRKSWRVLACYLDDSYMVILWETHELPHWVKRVRRNCDGTGTQSSGQA